MPRIFDNPLYLLAEEIEERLHPLDATARVKVYDTPQDTDPVSFVHYADIESTLNDATIDEQLRRGPNNDELAKQVTQTWAVTGYAMLPAWVQTGSADAAETYINNQIWNGADLPTIEAYIDAQIGTVTGSSLATALTSLNAQLAGVRTVLKAAAGAIVGIRGLFILTSKLLIYIRDLVIRWRQ